MVAIRFYPMESLIVPAAPLPLDEAERLSALKAYKILDTPAEEAFDRITRMARKVFSTQIALVSLVDGDRQWFKSKAGLEAEETPRSQAFCGFAILQDEPFVVEDATADPRFTDNPLVLGAPNIRFYAGAPLKNQDGHRIGTLCVIDDAPRLFHRTDLALLEDLGEMVMNEIELRNVSQVNADLQHLVNRDPLTDAYNRRAFEAVIDAECNRATRYDRPLTLAVMDLDDFRFINETHGQAVGDQVIKSFAKLCQDNCREQDVFARLGGGEFAILMPETSVEEAEAGIQRIVKLAADDRPEVVSKLVSINGDKLRGPTTIPYTVSAGLSLFNPEEGVREFLHTADENLYRAKRAGKNQCIGELPVVFVDLE